MVSFKAEANGTENETDFVKNGTENIQNETDILQNETQIHARVDYVLQKHNLLRKESSSKVTHICLGANNIVKELEVFVDLGRNRFKGGNDVM